MIPPVLPIHVADFLNRNYTSYWIGGRYYYGNEYFYTNIARLTTANYHHIRSGYSISELVASAFEALSGFISSFDLYTRLQNGFCYGRFNLNSSAQSIYLDRPILQIGKYTGTLPFIIEASGVYKSNVFSQQFEVQESDVAATDSLSNEIWVGNYIRSLASQEQTNDIINEILDYSIDERVLSIYSAFICLEPEQGGDIYYNCPDESRLITALDELEQVTDDDSLFQAYPNPFNTQTTIKINLLKSIDPQNISFKIYNVLGQIVRTYQPEVTADRKHYEFIWDGTNDNGIAVTSGNYFFIVLTPEKRYSLKLLLLK